MISGEDLLAQKAARLSEEAAREIVERHLITPYFQPIVDLQHAVVMGWEVLSRGPESLCSPAAMFATAKAHGLLGRLDLACRVAGLQAIAALPVAARQRVFFLNVSLCAAREPLRLRSVVLNEPAGFGLEPRNLVIEITERESIDDYQSFETHLRHYAEQGFRIALDDLGAGHSRLLTLVTYSPHFLKLDMSLVRGVERDTSKQRLIKSLVAFAAGVDAVLIAKGVETWDELGTLARLGIRHAQGFVFGQANRMPEEILDETRAEICRVMPQSSYRDSDLNESVDPLVAACTSIREGEKRGEDINRMFHSDPSLDHLIVVRGQAPVGLITRQHYYTHTGGPVGYPLFQWKPAEQLARYTPLIVEDSTSVTAVARLAMERPPDQLYDPVVVVNQSGQLLGTVTIKQLLKRSSSIEVQWAQGASPLTGLPGNRSIERWILAAFRHPDACVLYADLDRFKEFNDCYGFLRGDQMIRCLSRVLSAAVSRFGPEAHLGHIGGDDFVIVTSSSIEAHEVEALCGDFDEAKRELFSAEDIERGYFRTTDRRGQATTVPLVTVSVAVVPVSTVKTSDHPGALAQMAASLKRKVKEMTAASRRSTFLFERRGRRET